MNKFLILPNTLFDVKYLSKYKNHKFVIYEHPDFFTKYNFNKKKLILHRASMKYYYDYLKNKGYNVEYNNYNKHIKIENLVMFDPINKIETGDNVLILDSPNFLLSSELMNNYRSIKKTFFFSPFYNWSKKQLNIIPDVKSTDKENRKKIPKGMKIPSIPDNKEDEKYIKEAKKYVTKNFGENYGDIENFIFPVSHKVTKKWLDDFIENRFKNFGAYEDAICTDNNFLFHSLLSSLINIGLINPIEIVKEIEKVKSTIEMNNYEGFIRQLFWREYQRYCYTFFDYTNLNYFGFNKKLTKKWYNGTIGVKPVDDCIINGFKDGYLHHIQRLMVVGNFMLLSEIDPREAFRWFMEFSCDSYEWVMTQNVLDMVFFVSKGKTMRRPYASKSNYVMKMSNYKRGEWNKIWDETYDNFGEKYKDKLYNYRYFFRGIKFD